MSGLKADFETVEGQFSTPKELNKIDTIARLDILSDWKHDLLKAIDEAHVECFIDMIKPDYNTKISFEQAYDVQLKVLEELDIDLPDPSSLPAFKAAFKLVAEEYVSTKH